VLFAMVHILVLGQGFPRWDYKLEIN